MSSNSVNFVPLSDDLWGLGPKPSQQQQQPQPQQTAMMMGAPPPGYGMSGGAPPPQQQPSQQQQQQQQQQQSAQLVREVLQLKQFVAQMAQHQQMKEAAGSPTDKWLMWLVIILSAMLVLFLIKFIIWCRRGKGYGSSVVPSAPAFSSYM